MGLVESDAYPETTPLPETWREVAENRPVDFFRWFCAPQVRQDASGGVSVRQAGTYVSHVGEVRVGVDKRDVLDAVRRSSARLWKPKAGSGRYMKYSFPPPDGDSGDASRIRRVYYAVSLLGAITGDLGPYRDFHVACSEGRGVRSSIASARDACGRMGWTLVDKPRPSGPFEPRHLYAFRNCALAVESLR